MGRASTMYRATLFGIAYKPYVHMFRFKNRIIQGMSAADSKYQYKEYTLGGML